MTSRPYAPSSTDSTGFSDVEAAIRAGLQAAVPSEVVPGKLATVVVPEDSKVVEIDLAAYEEMHSDSPNRRKGCFHVHDADSFIAYMAKHALNESEVWSDAQGQKIIGVINAHTAVDAEFYGAGWGDHTVVYQVQTTDAWKAWMALNGKLIEQVPFANHIEDRMVDIQVPDAADLLEIAQSFEANTNVSFQSANVLASGERQFVYREETDARAGRSGQLSIPKEFELLLQPFEGAALFPIIARLRYRLRDGSLSLGYQLVCPEDILRAAFVSVSDAIREGVEAPVFLGSTA